MSHVEVSTINKKIQQTKQEIENAILIENETLRYAITSELEKRLKSLEISKNEIENSLAKEIISLRIYGDKIETGKISNRLLLSALSGFQGMIDSIANAIHHSPTSRGRIPSTIQKITELEVVGTFAGSFGIILEKEYDQYGVSTGMTKLNKVLDEMFNVLETVDDSEQLISVISPYGKRTVLHYREWLDNLKDNEVDLELNWKDDAANNRKINLLNEKSSDIISTLDTIDKIDNEEVVLQGTLTGVNIRNHSFEMSIDGVGIVKGTAMLETLIAISESIGKEIVANLIRSTSYTKANVQKISWYLGSV